MKKPLSIERQRKLLEQTVKNLKQLESIYIQGAATPTLVAIATSLVQARINLTVMHNDLLMENKK